MNYKPIGARLIVRILERPEFMVAGIKLTTPRVGKHEWSDEILWAEVIKLGDACGDHISIGDVVIMRGDAGKWVDYEIHAGDTRTHRVVEFDEVLAIDIERTDALKQENLIEASS